MRLPRFCKEKHQDERKTKINKAFTSNFWYENILIDFIACYKMATGEDPTDSVIEHAALVPKTRKKEFIDKLIADGWVTTYGNGHTHYETKIVY